MSHLRHFLLALGLLSAWGCSSESDTPPPGPGLVSFVEPESGFSTSDVYDADREIVHFDAELGAMIWSASGDAVSGWAVSGADLSWEGSGVAFRVRFGSEGGEPRAYFTERDRGTLCNLDIAAPDELSIRATSETPPLE